MAWTLARECIQRQVVSTGRYGGAGGCSFARKLCTEVLPDMKLTRLNDYTLPTGVLGLAVAPDGSRAFAACADGALYDVDMASGKSEPFEERHPSFASGCVLLPDGKTVISGGYDGALLWHDVETRRCWRRVQAHRFWNWKLALSPDGTRLAATTGQYLPGGWIPVID